MILNKKFLFLFFANVVNCFIVNYTPSKIQHNNISFLKSYNQFYTEIKDSDVRLDDIGGLEYAKEDIYDIIDFLQNPEKYKQIGAKLPKGILLTGPPGSGKTMLAKGIAGEAGVPFFAAAGSSFVEVYVGMGSKRIREIFKKATSSGPSIIFIDEIDAIGNKRSMSPSRNEEREATLNQLLAEIDGIVESNVIVIGATNFPEMLDNALIRSGRLEKKIITILPDLIARYKILTIHTKNKKLEENIDLYNFAKQMTNLNGADISMIINNAAIKACRNNETTISSNKLQESYNSFLFGNKLTERVISNDIKLLISVHEAAHALISTHFNFDKVIYISIIPNTKGDKGITIFRSITEFPENNIYSKEYLFAKICTLLAGRIGEQIIFGDNKITTGAINDIYEARNLVSKIVNEFSMTNEILPLNLKKKEKEILEFMYEKTKQILISKKYILEYISKIILDKEELFENDFDEIIKKYNIYEEKKNVIKNIIQKSLLVESTYNTTANKIIEKQNNFIDKKDNFTIFDDCDILTNDEIYL